MPFWKPGTIFPGSNVDRNVSKEGNIYVHNKHQHYSIDEQRKKLPIYKFRRNIVYSLKELSRVLILVGETGSGKTTQIPQYLFETGFCDDGKIIGCTQPRRISCISVSKRVAEEKNVTVGSLVGYSIQFDPCYDERKTKIKYVTDGLLIREMMLDPLLNEYGVLMIDEAHERSMYTDLVIGLIKKIMKKREDLKVIISSATLHSTLFEDFFRIFRPQTLYVEGKQFPVDVYYLHHPTKNYKIQLVETILNIHSKQPLFSSSSGRGGTGGGGDILCFCTGQSEIFEVMNLIESAQETSKREEERLVCLPLFSQLPLSEQMKVFEPLPYVNSRRQRKCILSTNIAENSITIEGIQYVIDCGFVKLRTYRPERNKESLVITEVSKASAEQRCGRAGRIQFGGQCYRLMTEKDFQKLRTHTVPEIQRSNLVNVILQLKSLGIDDLIHFEFISSPPSKNVAKSLETLYLLGIIDSKCNLTKPLGTTLAEFPLDPRLGKVLMKGFEFGCGEQILTIVSFLMVDHVFSLDHRIQRKVEKIQQKFSVLEGDMICYLNIWEGFMSQSRNNRKKWCQQNCIQWKSLKKIMNVRNQLKSYLQRFHIYNTQQQKEEYERKTENTNKRQEKNVEMIQKCFCFGFFQNVAQLSTTSSFTSCCYYSISDEKREEEYYIHPSSTLFQFPPKWVLFFELVETSKIYMREIMKIKPEWISESVPSFFAYERKSQANLTNNYQSSSSKRNSSGIIHRRVF